MKKILWTTLFWLIVAVGFVFYMKMYNVQMVNDVSKWLGATSFVSQDTLTVEEQASVMSGIATMQTTLSDMQTKLDILAGGEITPVEVEAIEKIDLSAKAE